MDTTTTSAPAKAGRREWLGLATLAIPTMLIGLDMTVLHLAVPELSSDLRPSSSQLLWITDIYGFLIAGFLITMGTLGDRIGRRRLLLIGAAAFGLASVLAAYSTSAEMLIAARALLGITGATLMPSTLSLISNMFQDPRQRSFAIAVWMINFMVGGAVGPLIGGLLLEHFWWGSVFLISAPAMAILLVLGRALLPEYRNAGAGRLDMASVALSLAAILAVVYGVKEIAKGGSISTALAVLGGGLVVGAVFVRRQRRLTEPLMDLKLLGDRRFSTALGAQLAGLLVIAGMQFLIIQYLQLVLDVSARTAGLLIIPGMVVAIGTSLVAPALARRWRHAPVIAVSMLVSGLGLVAVTQAGPDSSVIPAVLGFTIISLAINPAVALTYDLVIGSAPPERAGSASGMAETSSELGLAMGVAASGSIATAVYRGRTSGDALPDGLESSAHDLAGDTLPAALDVAAGLPAPTGSELLEVARDAFSRGLQVAGAVNLALMVAMAALVAILLRRAGEDGEDRPS
ncbi:MFS transporter [Phytoactinopolyspora halotolerans]|uniref:MFS transporter n=1 Tax=Phytoactinopolyspora halotolerans TaxID=1981512 RepID=A0A6L9SAW1_9ACTN|nr:MFS transporter [Phytoactinopolyspora halotolerans]NEE01712.1 MFS transporter [Phytoactinopolyspora halotolerans]